MSKQNLAPDPGDPGALSGGRDGAAAPETEAPAGGAPPERDAPDSAASPADAGERHAARDAERIASLEAQLAEAKDQYLRKAAEFENFRKRMNQEKQDAVDYANQSILLDLIQVMDDLERAIKAAQAASGGSAEFTNFVEGVSMIEKRLSSQLENKWGLKRFDSAGEPFDPNRHEALMMEKSTEVAEPQVAEEFLKGYTLKDRVVRSAKVKVLMPEAAGSGETPEVS